MGERERTKAYYERYHTSEKARANNRARKRARYHAEKDGKVKPGDGKEIDHKKALSNGGSYDKSNTRVVSRKQNRSYKRDKNNKPIGPA